MTTGNGETAAAPSGGAPSAEQLAELLAGLGKAHVGAAMSKLISASVGDIAMVFSRSAQHKHYTFADLEWMVLPAVLAGQFYVAEIAHKEIGTRAPVAAVLWASVSDETDARLAASPARRIRLRPDEWQAGPHLWIVDVAGDAPLIGGALAELARGPLKDKAVKVVAPGQDGAPGVQILHELIERAAATARAGAAA